MAQILTAPELNPDVRDDRPNQVRQLKQTVNILLLGEDTQRNFRQKDYLSSLQMDFQKLPNKDKFLNYFLWNLTDTGLIKSLEINNAFIRKAFGSITANRFNFLDYMFLEISILPTNNSQYLGELAIAWVPIPANDYFEKFYGFTSIDSNPTIFTQFTNVRFEPNNSNVTKIMLPMKALVKFIMGNTTIGSGINADLLIARNSFLDSIVYGYLNFYVITKLDTKSTVTNLNISYSVAIYDAKSGAITYT